MVNFLPVDCLEEIYKITCGYCSLDKGCLFGHFSVIDKAETKLSRCGSCQIRKNVNILLKTFTHDPKNPRYMYAIWRLYRYDNVSPQQIAFFLGESPSSVQQLIGEVFKALCLSDESCTFKKLFDERTHGEVRALMSDP